MGKVLICGKEMLVKNEVLSLGEYHRYWLDHTKRLKNPGFDEFSSKVLDCHPADYKLPLWSDCLGLNVGENTVPLKVMGTFSSYSGNLRRSQAHVTAHGSI